MYSEKVMDHFQHPRNVGEIENASGVGTVGNAKCGDIMRMYLDIDDNGIIQDCKFKTFGCGAAIATSSMATELIIGETDVEYCLDYIEDGDDLIILDAAFEEDTPGTINVYSLVKLFFQRAVITQHQPSLLEAIRVYKMGVKGILITIEITEISFGLGISEGMKGMLPHIVEEVRKSIDDYIGG